MAIPNDLKLVQNIDGLTGIIYDVTSGYGSNGNDARDARASYLSYSYNDYTGERNYNNIDSDDPLTQMEWSVPITTQGWAQGTLYSFKLWDAAVAYIREIKNGSGIVTQYGNVIYYEPTNKIYKAKLDHTGIAPDGINGTTYWTEVTDLATLENYESVDQYTEDFILDSSISACITKKLVTTAAKCGCKGSLKDWEEPLLNWALYISGVANFNNGSPEKMKEIFDDLAKVCKC